MTEGAEILTPFGKCNIPGAQQEVVAALRSCLERAERGELVSIVLAGVMPNGNVFSTWHCGSASAFTVYGSACYVTERIAAAVRRRNGH